MFTSGSGGGSAGNVNYTSMNGVGDVLRRLKLTLWDNPKRQAQGKDYITWAEYKGHQGVSSNLRNKETPSFENTTEEVPRMDDFAQISEGIDDSILMYLGVILLVAVIMK